MSGKKTWMSALAAVAGGAVLVGGLAFTGTPLAQAADPQPVAIATLFTRGVLGHERTVKGYVTAEYSEGGIGGFMVQKANSGGSPDARVQAPQAIRVRGAGANVGDYVMVTGTVSDRGGLRGLDSSQDRVQGRRPKETARRPVPITDLSNIKGSWTDEASLARISGMLVQPKGDFTVTGLGQAASRGEVSVLPGGTARKLGDAAASRDSSSGGKSSGGKSGQKTSDQPSPGQADVPLLILDDGASQDAAERAPQRSWSGQQTPVVGDTVNFVAHSILMPAVNAPGRTDGWHFQPTTAIASDTKVLPTKITPAPSTRHSEPSTRQSEPSPRASGSAASTTASGEPGAPATPAANPLQKTREEIAARARTAKEAAEKAGADAEAKREAAKQQAERAAAAAAPTAAPSSARRLLAAGAAAKPTPTPSSSSTHADDEESDAGPLSLPAIPKAARGNLSRPITGSSGSSENPAPQQHASGTAAGAGNGSGGSAATGTPGATSSASRSGGAVTSPDSTGSTPAKGSLQGGSTGAKNSHDVADPQRSTAQVIRLGAQADPPLAGSIDQGRTATTVLVVVAACLAIATAGAGFVQRRRSQ